MKKLLIVAVFALGFIGVKSTALVQNVFADYGSTCYDDAMTCQDATGECEMLEEGEECPGDLAPVPTLTLFNMVP